MTRLILTLCLLCASVTAQATIYRWINAQGDVEFSDVPPPGGKAQKLDLQPLDTIPVQPGQGNPSAPPGAQRNTAPAARYASLVITNPSNGDTIRANNGDVTVQLGLSPSLQRGDQIRLFMDGVQVYAGTSTHIPLKHLDRGEHTLYAVVDDPGGGIVIRSPAVSFSLMRHSILFNPPPKNGTTTGQGGVQQAPRAPMMPRAPQFTAPN